MTFLDWMIVLVVNGSIIVYGLYLARGTETSGEWFLASRALPWWAVGLSMFATNVDNADLVGVTGQTYNEGIHVITVYALGSAFGGLLAAFWIVPAISRRGLYTNAEYLEVRFSPSMRIFSALIQIQYRTSMLGMMIWSTYLVLTRLVKLDPWEAWGLIVALVILTGLYTSLGGLKSVVWTDAAQGIVIMAAAVVIFSAVWDASGGWEGISRTLAERDRAEGTTHSDKLHIGGFHGDQRFYLTESEQQEKEQEALEKTGIAAPPAVAPIVVAIGWIIIGSGYWTVNHTQTMRLMGARSIRDMKLAAVFGVALSLPVMMISALIGVMAFGMTDVPEMEAMKKADELYPLLAKNFLSVGFKGLVVAGVLAAVISTFDSMGSALSAIFTRDIYARLIAPERDDRHYVLVGRLATAGVLLIGFLYLPFIWRQEHMLKAFTTLIPVFVTPLFVVYLAGVFTRAHARSGLVGLGCGSLYGVIALIDRQFYDITFIPGWFTERWGALLWSVLWTSLAMAVTSFILGRQPVGAEAAFRERGWLERSREELAAYADEKGGGDLAVNLATAAVLAVSLWVTFVWLW